jgi:Methyltransferase domain
MTPAAKLAPSTGAVPVRVKARESADLVRHYLEHLKQPMSYDPFADLLRYDELLREYAGLPLARARAFEIGFGQRPYRLLGLRAMGVDVRGVDAEVPVVDVSRRALAEVYRRNGLERFAKTLVRRTLFDWRDNRAFRRSLRERGLRMPEVEPERLIVADATTLELVPGELDLIYSEDVFEHIDAAGLRRLVARMAGWLRPGGLAVIRPNVFTGITGGHLVEWKPRTLLVPNSRERRTQPWQHLLTDSFATNTYLNRLTRAEFRELFAQHFEILAEEVALPDLGRELLSSELRERLAGYPDEELFSNQVRFVLRPRQAGPGEA